MLSAESLLADPALFWRRRAEPGGAWASLHAPGLLLEYLDLAEQHPVPNRMIRAHAFKILGAAAVLPMSACIQHRAQLHGPHVHVFKDHGSGSLEALTQPPTCSFAAGVRDLVD